jgi:hypothetical protein
MSRALTPSLGSYGYQKQEGNTHLVKPAPIYERPPLFQTLLKKRLKRLIKEGMMPH